MPQAEGSCEGVRAAKSEAFASIRYPPQAWHCLQTCSSSQKLQGMNGDAAAGRKGRSPSLDGGSQARRSSSALIQSSAAVAAAALQAHVSTVLRGLEAFTTCRLRTGAGVVPKQNLQKIFYEHTASAAHSGVCLQVMKPISLESFTIDHVQGLSVPS